MTCAICCDSSSNNDLVSLECGHSYHASCIFDWAREGRDSCPMCRKSFVKEQPTHIPVILDENDIHKLITPLLRHSHVAPRTIKTMLNRYRKHRSSMKQTRNAMIKHEMCGYGSYRSLRAQTAFLANKLLDKQRLYTQASVAILECTYSEFIT
jgi:hypothetical protein